VAYRIQRGHPRMSGGFPASAVATGRWLAVIPNWRAGLAAMAVLASVRRWGGEPQFLRAALAVIYAWAAAVALVMAAVLKGGAA
jgi:hypothetical protein